MKRNLKIGTAIALMVTATALYLSGCTEEKNQTEEIGTGENITEIVETESPVQESTENLNIQTEFDVQKVLEEAEIEASVKQKKLQEDASLTQTDMNILSGEICQIWDEVLNDLWKNLKSTLDKESWSSLLEEQRAWIMGKEEDVKQAGAGGGSIAILAGNQRAAELTRTRVYELAFYLGFEGTMITFMVEGMEEVVPATVFEGLRYTLTIPKEGWEMNVRECWASEVNENAQFWVTDYDGKDIDLIFEGLQNKDYEKVDTEPYFVSYEDADGIVHCVKLFTENEETIGVFYCYPKETAEGFGTRIRTIVNTFCWDFK